MVSLEASQLRERAIPDQFDLKYGFEHEKHQVIQIWSIP
jgi:hypothetical protein